MFTTALLIISKNWKQSKCPSTDKWINKMWYINTRDFYSTIKGNKVLMYAKTWLNTENIMTSERSQSEKTTYSTIPFL